jgi:GNAT superfamily N-acetyltransferase
MEPSFKIEKVTAENIDEIGLYCSRSKYKEKGYQNKFSWVKKRFEDGLEYHVLLVDEGRKDMAYRGMIEYMPAEKCWRGINAPGYMVVHCLWVIGRHKNKGYGSMLLQRCIDSAKEKELYGVVGMVIKKGGWLPKKDIYLKNGFKEYDDLNNEYQLYGIKFREDYPDPRFHPLKPEHLEKYKEGFTVISSSQCPYMSGTIESLKELAGEMGEKVKVIEMDDFTEAQLSGLHPYGTFHIIWNGEYVSHLPGGMRDIKKAVQNKISKNI